MNEDSDTRDTRLDSNAIQRLESSIPEKAKDLLLYLRSLKSINLHNAKLDNYPQRVKAYSRNYKDYSEIWLTVDHEDVIDSFVHEIGQVCLDILGYKIGVPKRGYDQRLIGTLVTYANNAFIGTVAEQKLEKYGIDRSFYKARAKRNFEAILNNRIPAKDSPDHALIKEPHNKAHLCYIYVANRLLLGKDFEPLDRLWNEKVKFTDVKDEIKAVYIEAAKKEITPDRFTYLRRFFARTLGLGNIFA